ncbi:hypothetical protein ACNKHR_10875 [Shigella flexneri]
MRSDGRGVVFNVRSVDGDTASFFFRRVINLVECASSTAGVLASTVVIAAVALVYHGQPGDVPTLTCGFVGQTFLNIDCPSEHG